MAQTLNARITASVQQVRPLSLALFVALLTTITHAGQGIYTPGTPYQDVQCKVCVAGTFADGGGACPSCDLGHTFSHANASINCTACQQCPGQNFSSLCNLTHDNVCISQCPTSWEVVESSRLCTKCAPGYRQVDNNGTLEEQCQRCPANSYCLRLTEEPTRCPAIK